MLSSSSCVSNSPAKLIRWREGGRGGRAKESCCFQLDPILRQVMCDQLEKSSCLLEPTAGRDSDSLLLLICWREFCAELRKHDVELRQANLGLISRKKFPPSLTRLDLDCRGGQVCRAVRGVGVVGEGPRAVDGGGGMQLVAADGARRSEGPMRGQGLVGRMVREDGVRMRVREVVVGGDGGGGGGGGVRVGHVRMGVRVEVVVMRMRRGQVVVVMVVVVVGYGGGGGGGAVVDEALQAAQVGEGGSRRRREACMHQAGAAHAQHIHP